MDVLNMESGYHQDHKAVEASGEYDKRKPSQANKGRSCKKSSGIHLTTQRMGPFLWMFRGSSVSNFMLVWKSEH